MAKRKAPPKEDFYYSGLSFRQRNGGLAPCSNNSYHSPSRSGRWLATWLGYPVGAYCEDCRKEMEGILEVIADGD